jgi:hypothetical protein
VIMAQLSYAVRNRCRRIYKFVSPQVANKRLAFFSRPRYLTLVHPDLSLIRPITCSTRERTLDPIPSSLDLVHNAVLPGGVMQIFPEV